MAVDTKERRLAMIAMDAAGTGIHTLPEANGAFEAGDRFHLLDLYSGFGATGAPGGTTEPRGRRPYIMSIRRHRRPLDG